MSAAKSKLLFLFDVDGTLTASRQKVEPWMDEFLSELRKKHTIGFVGGSDLPKQIEQLGDDLLERFDYCFPENGLVAYKNGKRFHINSIKDKFGMNLLKPFLNFCLKYMADLDIPVKTGTFIEFRNGLINLCPVGRNCSQQEREEFYQYDQEHKVRETMVAVLEKEFGEQMGIAFAIGGQISIDCFPTGWDKTYSLQFVENCGFEEIHFFGDKTHKGGNDIEIYEDPRTIGHRVTSPKDTKSIIEDILSRKGY
eukprot:218359_1